jgi:hypothetical protein
MNITQLKRKLEPWIRKIIREEINKITPKEQQSTGLFGLPIYTDKQMDQVMKNASKAMKILGIGKKDNLDANDMEEVRK